jgi:hypothetical protein
MKKPPKTYWIAERNEALRRARNARFYAGNPDISEHARELFMATCRAYVAEAREAQRGVRS